MSEPDVSGMLGKKIGPLPVAGWAAAIVGGLGISWYLRSRGGGAGGYDASGDDAPAPLAPPTGMGGAAVSDGSYAGGITPPTSPDNAGEVPIVGAIETNAQWRQQAVKWLVGSNKAPAVVAERAAEAYLGGKALDATAVGLINAAIAAIGPTPQAVPPIVVAPLPGAPAGGGPANAPKPPPKQTNKMWADKARAWLTRRYSSNLFARQVVYKLFTNRRMTQREANAAGAVMAALGKPPQGYWPILLAQPKPPNRRDTGQQMNGA